MALFGRKWSNSRCRLIEVKRTSQLRAPKSENDPGCVKTQKLANATKNDAFQFASLSWNPLARWPLERSSGEQVLLSRLSVFAFSHGQDPYRKSCVLTHGRRYVAKDRTTYFALERFAVLYCRRSTASLQAWVNDDKVDRNLYRSVSEWNVLQARCPRPLVHFGAAGAFPLRRRRET